ncbi:MAG: phosphotransferase [bacterium]
MELHDINRILEEKLKMQGWTIEKPRKGRSKESYVADCGDVRVFVKFDVSDHLLKRLAELRVAPPLLASGHHGGRPFVIQQFVAGPYPERRWFAEHLSELAAFIRTYQNDERLRALLTAKRDPHYRQHIADELDAMRGQLETASSPIICSDLIRDGFRRLQAQAKVLEEVKLVPTHTDPNRKNFILSGEQFVMIDWDDLFLSDPLRDVGLLLWWYVPKDKWKEFFGAYGQTVDRALLHRLYWWAAQRSLAIGGSRGGPREKSSWSSSTTFLPPSARRTILTADGHHYACYNASIVTPRMLSWVLARAGDRHEANHGARYRYGPHATAP